MSSLTGLASAVKMSTAASRVRTRMVIELFSHRTHPANAASHSTPKVLQELPLLYQNPGKSGLSV
jgi:hypothetical protein